MKGFRKLQKK